MRPTVRIAALQRLRVLGRGPVAAFAHARVRRRIARHEPHDQDDPDRGDCPEPLRLRAHRFRWFCLFGRRSPGRSSCSAASAYSSSSPPITMIRPITRMSSRKTTIAP